MPAEVTAQGLPETAAPSAEYVAQMSAATHTDPTPAPAANAAPAAAPEVPAKFKNADGTPNVAAILASYSELEKKQSQAAPAAATPPAAEGTPPAAEPAPGVKIEKPAAAAPAPLADALTAFRTAYDAGTELTDDHFKPLTDAGLPREMIDTYLAGVKAIESTIELSAHEAAGGKDKFEAARTWAASALTDAELDYYNTQAGNPATAKQAVEWLMGKHGSANPSEGAVIDAQAAQGAGGDNFTSQAQVTEAIASREYKTDPAFRQKVAEKLHRSIQAGSIRSTAEFHSR